MRLASVRPPPGRIARAAACWAAVLLLPGCSLVVSGKLDELPERPKDAGSPDMFVPPPDGGVDAGPDDASMDAGRDGGGEDDGGPGDGGPGDGGDVDACTEALPDPLDGVDDDCNGQIDDDALEAALDTTFQAAGRPAVAQLMQGWIVAFEKPGGGIDGIRLDEAGDTHGPVALTTATDTGAPALATSDDLPVLAFVQAGTGRWGVFVWDDTSVGFANREIYPLTGVAQVAVAADPMRGIVASAGDMGGTPSLGVGGTLDAERGTPTAAGAAVTGLAAAVSGDRVVAVASLAAAPGLALFHRRVAEASYATVPLDPAGASAPREPSYAVQRGEGHLVFTGDVGARASVLALDVRPDGTGAGAAAPLVTGATDALDQPSVALLSGGDQAIAYRRATAGGHIVELVLRDGSGAIVSGPHRVSPAGSRDDSLPVVSTSRVTGTDPMCRGLVAFRTSGGQLSLARFSCR